MKIEIKAAHLNRRGLEFLRLLLWGQMSLKKKGNIFICHYTVTEPITFLYKKKPRFTPQQSAV